MPYASSDGVRLYYEEAGKGTPMSLAVAITGPLRISIVSTWFQSIWSPSVNSQPRQKFANTGPGKLVG